MVVGNEAMVNPLPPANLERAERAKAVPYTIPATVPNLPLPSPGTYPRTIVGAESTGERNSLEDLFARRSANLQAADLYPSSKVTQTPEGYEIAPPLPPGQHPSRFQAFLKGLGRGAEAGAPYGVGGIVGGAIRGGITGAVSPDTINRQGKLETAGRATSEIATQLGIQKEQAGIQHINAQSVRDLSAAAINARFPNRHQMRIPLPNGGSRIIRDDGMGGIETIDQEPGSPTYATDIGGHTGVPLNASQLVNATNAQATREATEIERAYQHQQDAAKRATDAAVAFEESGAIDSSIGSYNTAEQGYRAAAATGRQNITAIDNEMNKLDKADDNYEAKLRALTQAREDTSKRINDLEKLADGAKENVERLRVQGAGAKGRFKGNARPIVQPSKSGIERY